MGQRRRSRGPRDGGPRRHAGRSWTNLILRDTTTSRGAHLVEGIVLVPVPDAALPRVPHRTLHLLPGEIVHGGLARREMNARSGLAFYVPLFWVISRRRPLMRAWLKSNRCRHRTAFFQCPPPRRRRLPTREAGSRTTRWPRRRSTSRRRCESPPRPLRTARLSPASPEKSRESADHPNDTAP